MHLRRGVKLLATTTTDAQGRYQFVGLAPGAYKVQPKHTSSVRRFSPLSRNVTLGTQDQLGVDFTAVVR